jgi:hypothetical protein
MPVALVHRAIDANAMPELLLLVVPNSHDALLDFQWIWPTLAPQHQVVKASECAVDMSL